MTFDEILSRLTNVKPGGDDKTTARCPAHDDHANSLSIAKSGDGKLLLKCFAGCTVEGICTVLNIDVRDLFPAPKRAKRTRTAIASTTPAETGWTFVSPVPENAPDPDVAAKHVYSKIIEKGGDAWRFDYLDLAGQRLFCVFRFEPPGAPKEIRPLSLWHDRKTGSLCWLAKWPPAPLPLYGLDKLAESPSLPVLLGEGELKTDRAGELLGAKYVVASLPSGASAVEKVDLSLLDGRRVIAWPDYDAPGFSAMVSAARKLEQLQIARDGHISHSVEIVKPDLTWPKGYDIGDLIDAGWDKARLLEFIEQNSVGVDAFEQIARERFGNSAPTVAAPEIARLAALSPILYEQERKDAARRLGVRATVLDGEVERARPKEANADTQSVPQWVPPAEIASELVDGRELLTELIGAIRKFVMLDESAALVTGLWVLFTWIFEQVAETNVYLHVISPTAACGKSTLLKVLKHLTRSGWLLSRLSPSAFSRTLGSERRTLLLDEADAFLNENEAMRNLLDGASDPDTATVSFSVKRGDDWTPVELNVFVPIAIASIGALRKMQTVESRSIPIRLKRATRAELQSIAKGRRRELQAALAPIAAKCARWASDNVEKLVGVRPEMPDSLSGREQDKWEPLILVADQCGRDQQARAVAEAVAGASSDAQSLSELLLADVKALFEKKDEKTGRTPEELGSVVICQALAECEDRPWGEFRKEGKPITPRQLARRLRDFGLRPGTIRLGEKNTPKGYKLADLKDVFDRYSPIIADPIRHSATTVAAVGESGTFESATGNECGGSEKGISSYGENECGVVADRKAENSEDQEISDLEEAEIDPGDRSDAGTEEAEIDRLAAADADREDY